MEKVIMIDNHIPKEKVSSGDLVNSRLSSGPVRTEITIVDKLTGETEVVHNKILVPGSQIAACNLFGIDPTVGLPTYNKELQLEHTAPDGTTPQNPPIVCLWCAGRGGYGSSPSDVITVKNTSRIEPKNDIMPFRYVHSTNDLPPELRDEYFGRYENPSTGFVSYYFKAPDTKPELHIRYLDGTEVDKNMYAIDSTQAVEVYVQLKLSVNRLDFRDYIDKVLGWDKADFSTISLCTGWYDTSIIENPDAEEDDQIKYRWYQDILPYSKLNFDARKLKDLNSSYEFIYKLFY